MGLKSLIIKGILILTLVSSVAAIYTPQPVYSILFLILTFYGSALLLFSLGLNLFGFIYLIIYAGAIAVLLLFIVMMLDLKVDSVLVERRSSNTRGDFLLFISIVLCVLFEFSTFIFYNFSNLTSFNSWGSMIFGEYTYDALHCDNGLNLVGPMLYTTCSYLLILVGLILLVGLIGGITLTTLPDIVDLNVVDTMHEGELARPFPRIMDYIICFDPPITRVSYPIFEEDEDEYSMPKFCRVNELQTSSSGSTSSLS